MPRKARKKSESGIYHIIMRGINRQMIFLDDEDCHRFLQTIKYYKEKSKFQIFAYSLMGNHIHLLIKTGLEPLEQIMRRICGKYVYWYNIKHDRVGYLFQDRFKSEPVDDDAYFLTVLRYIHQNPLKAGLVQEIDQYPWSSYNSYLEDHKSAEIDFVLNLFSSDKEKALESFVKFNNQKNDLKCLDIVDKKRITDQEATEIIKQVFAVNNLCEIQKFDRRSRDNFLHKLKKEGLSVRMIEKLTGISRGVVLKA